MSENQTLPCIGEFVQYFDRREGPKAMRITKVYTDGRVCGMVRMTRHHIVKQECVKQGLGVDQWTKV